MLKMVFAASVLSFVPPADRSELQTQIMAADQILFDEAFNKCDLDALENILDPEVTMYHDQAGINTGRDEFIAPVKENICNGGPMKPLRKLEGSSTEIFPLYKNGRIYGAIQQGRHEFYIKEKGQEPYLTNRARFTNLWILAEDGWKLKSTYSWDHLNPAENEFLDADVLVAGFDRDDEIDYMLNAHNIPSLSVAIIREGVITEERSFGSIGDGRPASNQSIFNVASLAKPVSALVTLRLVNDGKFNLDEPLANYYIDPDIAKSPHAKIVTARHVLSHTTGLPNWRYLDEGGVGKLRFSVPPGEKYGYSGEGFEWLRTAIEVKTGESFETLASNYVFGPAAMTSSSYTYPADKTSRVALRYNEDGRVVQNPPHQNANAAANFMTTAGDYARFVAFTMKGAGLKPELVKEMFAHQAKVSQNKAFGLGWQFIPKLAGGDYFIMHSGADTGVSSLAVGWPEAGRGIVILSNSQNAVPSWGIILKEQFGELGSEVVRRNRED